ncbi:MAG: HEAT repeat domain-containing protein [Dolichospermum sp. DET73]|nr:HEAT repeat domain-containing protein [Dolichospermum sp. DET73]
MATVLILIEALKDKYENIRSDAAGALGSIGEEAKAAVPALIGALKDNHAWVRSDAAEALGKIGAEAKTAVPALIGALKDNDSKVRFNAAAALVNMGGEIKGLIPPLIEPFKDQDKYTEYARKEAAAALKVIGENYENKSATMPIADLDQVISDLEKALPALKGTQDKKLKLDSQIASINRSLNNLKKTRESRLLDKILAWLAKNPLATGGLICIIFFPFLWVKLSQVRRKPTA